MKTTMRICLAYVLVLACGAAMAEGFTGAVEDATITARIETTLMFNERLSPFDIKVHTDDGVVTLTGGVSDEIERDLAQKVAESVTGVRRVTNDLIVVEKTAKEPKLGWRQSVEDQTVAAAVRTRLLYHKEFKGLQIGVRCREGVVTLYGVVGSDYQKERIGRIAEETRGVDKVENNLTVHTAEERSEDRNLITMTGDELVEKHVESEILFNRYVSIRNLKVDVQDGVCILTGSVASEQQKALAQNIAETTQGVQKVRNDLRVETPPPPAESVERPTAPTRNAPAEVVAPVPSDGASTSLESPKAVPATPLAPPTPPSAPPAASASADLEPLPME